MSNAVCSAFLVPFMNLKNSLQSPYNVLIIIFCGVFFYAFTIDTPVTIYHGLIKIISTTDIVLADYIVIGGTGATLVNTALVVLINIMLLKRLDVQLSGATIMALWLLAAFSFFGKNIFNIWSIMLGGYLYARYQKQPFSKFALVILLSTALSPLVSQLAFAPQIALPYRFMMANILGVLIGFIMPSISANAMKIHGGYNLYNVGFAAGIVGCIFLSALKNFNFATSPTVTWSQDNNIPLLFLSIIIFSYLIFIGLYCGENNYANMRRIINSSGCLVSDYYEKYAATAYLNMGLLGIFTLLVLFLLDAPLNGPTLGGIFTIMGFGCFGKHIRNIIPIMLGCIMATFFGHWELNNPTIVLAILFSTCLAPIAGQFGLWVGLLAGFLHISVVMNINIGLMHGGLNLYNNGLAGGFVAIVLVPLIDALKQKEVTA